MLGDVRRASGFDDAMHLTVVKVNRWRMRDRGKFSRMLAPVSGRAGRRSVASPPDSRSRCASLREAQSRRPEAHAPFQVAREYGSVICARVTN